MPSLFSRRAIAVVAAIVTTAAGWVIAAPPVSAAEDTVSFPLRHSFSMAVGLPGAGRHEPTSCYDVEEGKNYICRIVSGYEELGDKRTFFVSSNDVLEQGSDPTFGITLVDAKGTQYEGCACFHVAERPSTWQPTDYAVAAAFIVAGFIFSALLPSWLWSVAGVVGFGAYLAWAARRNRRQPGMPLRWSPGQSPGPNS